MIHSSRQWQTACCGQVWSRALMMIGNFFVELLKTPTIWMLHEWPWTRSHLIIFPASSMYGRNEHAGNDVCDDIAEIFSNLYSYMYIHTCILCVLLHESWFHWRYFCFCSSIWYENELNIIMNEKIFLGNLEHRQHLARRTRIDSVSLVLSHYGKQPVLSSASITTRRCPAVQVRPRGVAPASFTIFRWNLVQILERHNLKSGRRSTQRCFCPDNIITR